jgi:hypothetical protein
MSKNMCVVLVGNLSEGFEVVGPFKGFDEAAGWCSACSSNSWVMSLEDPKAYLNKETKDGQHSEDEQV